MTFAKAGNKLRRVPGDTEEICVCQEVFLKNYRDGQRKIRFEWLIR